MDTTRTYILVRLWEDFPEDLDISKFEGVLRPDFGVQLDRVAAAWIRASLNGPKSDPIEEWAAEQPEPEPEFLALIEENVRQRIGITYLLHAAKHQRSPPHPHWSLIHAESTLERAHALAEAVEGNMRVGCRFEIALELQSTLKPAAWLNYERELEEWDSKHIDLREIGFGPVEFKSPLRRLREEALKLSPHLGPVSTSNRPAGVVTDAVPQVQCDTTVSTANPASGATKSSKRQPRRAPPRVLGRGHRDILGALEKGGWLSLEKRLKGPQLAKKAFGSNSDAEAIKTPAAELVQWGFAGSHPGPEGGYWITPEGVRRLHAEER